MTTNELYRKAIRTYGERAQCIVAIEELSELQKEICKKLRSGDLSGFECDALAEEIADSKIMIEQLILTFNCKTSVEAWRSRKLERLESRLADGD